MDSYRNLYTALSIVAMVLSLTVLATAQRRDRRDDDYYGRTSVNLSYSIKNLRNNSRRFEDILDRELDRSRYDGTRREDNLNKLAERFKNAAEDLDDEYEGRSRRSISSSIDEARRVVSYGSQLDVALSRSRLTYNSFVLQQSWAAIERDIQTIAYAYNLRYNGVYGRTRGGNYPGGYPDRGRVGTNGRYNRNLRATVENLKNNARRFEDRIDNERDRDRYGRRGGSNNLENLANRFKRATDRLEDRYDDRGDFNDSYDEARNVLNIGQQIDYEMSRSNVSSAARRDWSRIEADLRVLANAYNIRYQGNRGYGIGNIIRDWPF